MRKLHSDFLFFYQQPIENLLSFVGRIKRHDSVGVCTLGTRPHFSVHLGDDTMRDNRDSRDNRDASPGQRPEAPDKSSGLGLRILAGVAVLCLGVLTAFQIQGWFTKSREARDTQQILDTSRAELTKLQDEQKTAQQDARKDYDKATATVQKVSQDYLAELEKAHKDIKDKDFAVRLTGPAHIQPGAPNKWQIETRNHQGQISRPKKLEVAV